MIIIIIIIIINYCFCTAIFGDKHKNIAPADMKNRKNMWRGVSVL